MMLCHLPAIAFEVHAARSSLPDLAPKAKGANCIAISRVQPTRFDVERRVVEVSLESPDEIGFEQLHMLTESSLSRHEMLSPWFPALWFQL